MPYLVTGTLFVGGLCLLDLVLTLGVIGRIAAGSAAGTASDMAD